MAGNSPFSQQPPPQQSPYLKVLQCTSCGASMTLRASGQSMSAVCPSCKSILDVTHPSYPVISKLDIRSGPEPVIPLGNRGKLKGHLWEVIGFMRRRDVASDFTWDEYLLFNPFQGFRWLTESNGHWNFVVMSKERPGKKQAGAGQWSFLNTSGEAAKPQPYQFTLHSRQITFLDQTYKLYHRGKAEVVYVLGEFYWRVKVYDTVEVWDYIAPPEVLSCEKSHDEETWSVGEYMDGEMIRHAFDVDKAFPVKIGVAPNQPSAYTDRVSAVRWQWAGLLAVIILIQMAHVVTSTNDPAYQGIFTYSTYNNQKEMTTPSFDLKHGLSNVRLSFYAPVENHWFYLNGELVNDTNGEIIPFDGSIEYYQGYDSDGKWTEGSKNKDILLSWVPEGRYHINLEGESDEVLQTASIHVTRKVPIWVNFFWALVLVSLWPIFLWLRGRQFEIARWSDSDYSPYSSGDDDDE